MRYDIKRIYKDSSFRYVFKDPENFVHLYREITGKFLDKNKIIFKDVSSVVMKKEFQNDVSFLTEDNTFVILVEHQSTISRNMALRSLIYYVEFISTYVKSNGLNLYGRTPIKIPNVEFYVVYNGDEELSSNVISLSENFLESEVSNISLNVKIMNINYDNLKYKNENNDFVGYAYWLNLIKQYLKAGYEALVALEKARDRCLEENIFTKYLKKEEFLVISQGMYTLEDEIRDNMLYERNCEIAEELLRENQSIDLIERVSKLSLEEIEEIKGKLETE